MKMKKNLFLLAAVLLGMTACSNNDEIVEEPAVKGIPMTLTASIGSPSSTRTAYEWDGTNKILKVTWKSGDKVSLVSYDADGVAKTNDIFTTTGSGSSAQFTGTYTGSTTAPRVCVVYPALTKEDEYEFYYEDNITNRVFSISKTTEKCAVNFSNAQQRGNNDLSHLPYYDLMYGVVSDLSNPSAELTKLTCVYRLELDATDVAEGANIDEYVGVSTTVAARVFKMSDVDANSNFTYGGVDMTKWESSSAFDGNTGKFSLDDGEGNAMKKVAGVNNIIVYIPVLATGEKIPSGTEIGIYGSRSLDKRITAKSELSLTEPGKVYIFKVKL